MKTADNQLRKVKTRYNRYFDACRRHTNDKVSPSDSVFVKASLAEQPHKLTPIATGLFLVVTVDAHTITIQRPNSLVEMVSRNRMLKASARQNNDKHDTEPQLHDLFRISDVPNRRHSHVFAPHDATSSERGTGSESAKLQQPFNVFSRHRTLSCYEPRKILDRTTKCHIPNCRRIETVAEEPQAPRTMNLI